VTSAGSNLALAFIGYIFLLGTLTVLGFIMLIFSISLLYRSSKNTLTSSLIILLALAIPALFSSTFKNNSFISIISKINPLDNVFSSLDNILVDYQTKLIQNWQYLLPLLLFCFLMFLFLILSAKHFKSQGVIKKE
jgi:ABC-type Na+ efflux pump permease subunit